VATRQYNIAQNENKSDVAEIVGGAITSGAVEVTVDLAVVNDRREVIEALHQIEKHIMEGNWPPA